MFDTYTYELTPAEKLVGDDSLFLLYGENGAGKSTLLKLIYHVLHPEPFGGHRTFVSTVPFKHLNIQLSNGFVVGVNKPSPFHNGSYEVQVSGGPLKQPFKWLWRKGDVKQEDGKYLELCKLLEMHGPRLEFLPDTRKMEGKSPSARPEQMAWEAHVALHFENRPGQESLEVLATEAVERVSQWFRQQTIRDTNTGYTSVNSIYVELLRTIVAKKRPKSSAALPVASLREHLKELESRNAKFSEYGLTPKLEIDKLIDLLSLAKPRDASLLETILRPYLDGHNARLDALSQTQATIEQFVSTIAEFFSEKELTFSLGNGVEITSSVGRPLKPELLSSGEKQLLLLFCNAITARRDGTVLIIDEPEISLNVKWQRKLINSLLGCLGGVRAQIMMATHSIEILAQYQGFVTKLTNLKKSK